MLVLTRTIGDKIHIGGDITVVVTKTTGNRVALGIEAPEAVRIVRGELVRFSCSEQVACSMSNLTR